MTHFNQYGNYYDPVGSQPARPSGYSYQASPSTAAYQSNSSSYGSTYGSTYQRGDANTYNGQQQYRSGTTQQATSASHAAQALSSLSSQDYQGSSRGNSNNQYENASWYNSGQNQNVYGSSNNVSVPVPVPNRTQSNNSPLYPTAQSSSTYSRINVPEQRTQSSSSNTFGASQSSNRSYQTAYTQQPAHPPRYNSPLHAVQAHQHGHNKQSSRGSNQSPQISHAPQHPAQNRQQSSSVEPSPMTVDPSQVYDNRAELQRKAQIDAEKRRKYEAEQAAKRAEEKRIAEEKRKEEEAKIEEDARKKAEEEAEKKKAVQQKKNEQRRKAREDKKQSKSAATTLQQMASAMAEGAEGADEEEEEMRNMFKKMREFNAKNPALLAKLWDEERKTHSESSKTPQPVAAAPAASPSVPPSQAPSAKVDPASKAKAAISNMTTAPVTEAQQLAVVKAPGNNSSLWPPHKKSSLSEATAKWLNALPDNANVQVEVTSILNILNDNPSYVELCKSLENLGLKFDRSQLARELLKAVPDGMKTQPPGQPSPLTPLASVGEIAPQVDGSSTSSGASRGRGRGRPAKNQAPQVSSNTVNYEAPLSLSDAAREVNSMGQQTHQSAYGSPEQQEYQGPYFAHPQGQNQNRHESHQIPAPAAVLASASRPPSQSQLPSQSQSQSQPPEIRAELKPEAPPRPPADKEEAARKRTFNDLVDLTAEDSDDDSERPPPNKKVMQAPLVNGANNQSQQYLQKPVAFKHFMFNPQGQNMATSPYFQPNAQNGARPLGPGQQDTGPAARPTPPPKQRGPTREQLQQARMRGQMLVEPIMRDRVARKSTYDSRTIARDVLLATGRHPDMRGLNMHLAPMQKVLAAHGGEFDSGGNRSDLATIKWDIIDPVPPKKASRKEEIEQQQQQEQPPAILPSKESLAALPDNARDALPGVPARAGVKPKRGRPPRNSTFEKVGEPKNLAPRSTPARQTPSRPTTPSSAPAPASAADMSAGSSVGYAAFNQLNPDGTKKKGRPFGWKKSLHSREAQGLPKSKPLTGSRLKSTATPTVNAQQIEAHYPEYQCEWDECKSTLINVDTLKKHILKIHGSPNEQRTYQCWWTDCRKKGRAYKDIETWIKHVDEEHVRPLAWKLGDGPKGGVASETSHFYQHSSESTPPAYLSDSRGRSVTPIISPVLPNAALPAGGEEETLAHPTIRKPGRPPKPGKPPASSEGAIQVDPELSKLAEHQRLVGPMLERMGCILAYDERKMTFLDDEDFEDEVSGSEHDAYE